MPKWLILLFTLSMSTASAVPAWTWTDSEGTVHFSDTPVPGAKQIEIGAAQGFSGGARAARSTLTAAAPTPQTEAPDAGRYRSIAIMSPTQQQTLWNTGGTLSVSVSMDPGLRNGDFLDLVLDGQRRNVNTPSTQITLDDVFRGMHTLEAVVLDQTGTELARSPPTTFMVQQTSIANPR